MEKLWTAARAHAGVALFASAAVIGGAGVATAVAVQPTSSSGEVYESPAGPSTTEPATTTAAEAPVVANQPAPVTAAPAPVEPPSTATVGGVTQSTPEVPAPAQPAAPVIGDQSGGGYDPTAPWTDSTGRTYVPAPPPTVAPLPGEGVEEPA